MATRTEEQAAEDLEDTTGAEISPARGLAVDALGYLPRVVVGALEDLRTIAQSVSVLPEVARSLAKIEASVASMDSEVKLMRQGVDRLDGDVLKVVDGVDPLDEKLEDLRLALHPLSRASALFGRRGIPAKDPETDSRP
ncbi:MAG: hypothetical protein ACR2OC_00740 [Solirubrobacterales bacterium]